MSAAATSLCIVDDEKDVLDGLVPLLSNYDVHSFTSAQAALRAFEDGLKPDIVLSDLRMPAMSGFEMIEKMKELGLRSKVVVSSGHADKAAVIQAMNLGVQGFLEKPFTTKELRRVMDQVQPIEAAEVRPNLVTEELLELKDLYFERLARAENFIHAMDVEYPVGNDEKRRFLQELKRQNDLERKVQAQLRVAK